MQEGQVVRDLLLPADQKAPRAIEPRMGAFDFPATRLTTAMRGLGSFVDLAGDVRRVAPLTNLAIDRLACVSFVETEILRCLRSWLRALDGDSIQGFGDKLLVRHIGAIDGDGQGDATAIDQCRALHAQFAAIGRVFAGFFPHPAAIWSSPRPYFATSSRSPSTRRTRPKRIPTTPGTRPIQPTLGSSRESRCPTRTAWASPSIGNRWLAHTRCRLPRFASVSAGVHPWGSACKWEGTDRCVPKARRKSRETLTMSCRPYAPPCRLSNPLLNLHYGCLQPNGSVIG